MTERIDLHDQAMRVLDDLEANLRTACDDLRSLLANVAPKEDPHRKPEDMNPDGWVQVPDSPRWWQIREIAGPALFHATYQYGYRLTFRNNNASIYLRPDDTLPYLTDAEMQAQCDRELV